LYPLWHLPIVKLYALLISFFYLYCYLIHIIQFFFFRFYLDTGFCNHFQRLSYCIRGNPNIFAYHFRLSLLFLFLSFFLLFFNYFFFLFHFLFVSILVSFLFFLFLSFFFFSAGFFTYFSINSSVCRTFNLSFTICSNTSFCNVSSNFIIALA